MRIKQRNTEDLKKKRSKQTDKEKKVVKKKNKTTRRRGQTRKKRRSWIGLQFRKTNRRRRSKRGR